MTQQPNPAPAGLETDLIGRTVKAVPLARAGRILTGVVLPPAANARVPMLRLACPGRAPVRFDPGKYDVTTVIRDTYNFGNLPAEHLATKTMLKTEKRMQPAAGQTPIAFYSVRDGVAPLYAVADAVPMPALSPARAAAWAASRTCIRCGQTKQRPLPDYPRAGGRLCDTCQTAVAGELWTEQARAAQAETAEWARGVLADPDVLLIARDIEWSTPRIRIETLGANGTVEVILDARVRQVDDPGSIQHSPTWTAEKAEAWRQQYEGTMSPTDFRQLVDKLHEARVIAWYAQDRSIHISHELPVVDVGDQVEDRLALWSGEAPAYTGRWYPKPQLPWTWYPQRCAPYTAHKQLRTHDNLAAEIASLRALILTMAGSPAPEPTTPKAKP